MGLNAIGNADWGGCRVSQMELRMERARSSMRTVDGPLLSLLDSLFLRALGAHRGSLFFACKCKNAKLRRPQPGCLVSSGESCGGRWSGGLKCDQTTKNSAPDTITPKLAAMINGFAMANTKIQPASATKQGRGKSHMRKGKVSAGSWRRISSSPMICPTNCTRIRTPTAAVITSSSSKKQNTAVNPPSTARETHG